jgi:hypothetical protein
MTPATSPPEAAPTAGQTKSTRAALFPLCAGLLSASVSAAYIYARPDLTRGAAFLFGDEGANLFVAHALHNGLSLYTDVAFPYGPVGIELYATISSLIRNTPTVYLGVLAVLSAVTVAMVTRLLRGHLAAAVILAVVVLGFLPTMPLPGAPLGGYTSSIYMPVERIGLSCRGAALAPSQWPLSGQEHADGRRSCFGQGIRFGTGVVVLAAIVVVDQVASLGHGESRERRQALLASATALTGFLAAECAWVSWALLVLPINEAIEFLWPWHMWETHRSASSVARWPTWAGWRMAATQYMVPVSAGVLSGAGFVRWLRIEAAGRDQRASRQGALFILLVAYALDCVVFSKHEHHFRQFAWMLIPGTVPMLAALPSAWRTTLLCLWIPAAWPLVSALTHPPSSEIVRFEVPRGFAVYVPRPTLSRIASLALFARSAPASSGPVLFIPHGAGWLYAYDVPHVSRHTWFYSRAVVRPFEEAAFSRTRQEQRR